MSHTTGQPTGRFCASDPPPTVKPDRPRCRDYDHVAETPAVVEGRAVFCTPCEDGYARDVRMLTYDYVDLAQMQLPVLSQAMDTQTRGRGGPPMPMAGAPDALQAEIHYVLTLWESEVRIRHRMARTTTAVVGAWHTTVSNPPPRIRPRPGAEVQRACDFLATRIEALGRIRAISVYPTGPDDDPRDMAGWEAVLHLSDLHRRSRAMLGRTHRTATVPGSCSDCGAELWRDEPRYEQDPCPVYCSGCGITWTYDEYERYVGLELAHPRRMPRGGDR
jgi:hypothetical protein